MIVMKEAIERHLSRDANNYNKSIKITLKSEETKRHWQGTVSRSLMLEPVQGLSPSCLQSSVTM